MKPIFWCVTKDGTGQPALNPVAAAGGGPAKPQRLLRIAWALSTAFGLWAAGDACGAPAFIRETPTEFQVLADLDASAGPDAVVVDKATGNFRIGYGDVANGWIWSGVRASGIPSVTGLGLGSILDPARMALAFTSPEANRVHVMDVTDRTSAVPPMAVYPGGIGPNWVVALDVPGAGPLPHADLVLGSVWNAEPFRLSVLRSAPGVIQTLLDQADRGPLSKGNALELRTGGALFTVGMVAGAPDSELLVHRFNGLVPQVAFSRGLPGPSAGYAVGRFRGTPWLEFVFWNAGTSNLVHQPVEEPIPDQFQLGSETVHPLPEAIGDVVVVAHPTGNRLWVRSVDATSAAVYEFDGTHSPVLVERMQAPAGQPFTGAMSTVPGEIVTLNAAGPGGVTASAGRWTWDGTRYKNGTASELPSLATSSGSGNVLYFQGDPLVDEEAVFLGSANARDWASRPALGVSVVARAETYQGVDRGLGGAASVTLGAAPVGTTTVLSSQVSDAVSLFTYGPSGGVIPIDVTIQPSQTRHETLVEVSLTTSQPPQEVFYRVVGGGPWVRYTGAFRLARSATVQAYATAAGGSRSPVRSMTFEILVPPARLDSDSDGVPDYVEAGAGLDPVLSGADADRDGYSDLEELVHGSHPRIATNTPPSGSERLGPLGSFELALTPTPLDPVTGLPTQAVGGTVLEVHRPEGGLIQSGSLPQPVPVVARLGSGLAPTTSRTNTVRSAILAPVAFNTEHPLLVLNTPPTFGVLTTAADTMAGRELIGIQPLPALAELVLPGGNETTNASSWIAAASNAVHAFIASKAQRIERTLGPLDTLVSLLVERKLSELLLARGHAWASNLTLFPWRPTDAARTAVGTEDLLSLQQRTSAGLPGYRLSTVHESIAQATLNATDAATSLLREVAVGVYLVNARSNAVLPGIFPAPVDALRELVNFGQLNSNYLAANGWVATNLASVPSTVAGILASVPVRPVTVAVGQVRADSFGGGCSWLEGPSGSIALVDANGKPFRFPEVFQLLPGSEVSVTGYADVVARGCAGTALEVISAGVVAIPEATLTDANGNLLSDTWEWRFAAGGQRGETFLDRDGDGYTAFQEMVEGSDPGDAGSVPRAAAAVLSPPRMSVGLSAVDPNLVEFTWSWPSAYAHLVDFGLMAGGQVGIAFDEIATELEVVGDVWKVVVPRAELPQRFFRLAMRLR
jgi:hypothetical protein